MEHNDRDTQSVWNLASHLHLSDLGILLVFTLTYTSIDWQMGLVSPTSFLLIFGPGRKYIYTRLEVNWHTNHGPVYEVIYTQMLSRASVTILQRTQTKMTTR